MTFSTKDKNSAFLAEGEKIFESDGVRLCTESFGDPKNPALLLIMGAMSSMIWWDEEFCRRLAGTGRFVIRFDNRDTGRSQVYEPGNPPYTVDDMADDCIRVLDFWGVKNAHFLGMSLGGMLAQIAAMKYRDRAASVNCLASSLWGSVNPPLPDMDPVLVANSELTRTLDWRDKNVATGFMLSTGRLLCGKGRVFVEERHKTLAEVEFERSINLRSLQNYLLLGGGDAWWGRVSCIRVPVVVFHGTDDPLLPYQHGAALAKAIPGAKLVTLEGAGHECHRDDWEKIASCLPA